MTNGAADHYSNNNGNTNTGTMSPKLSSTGSNVRSSSSCSSSSYQTPPPPPLPPLPLHVHQTQLPSPSQSNPASNSPALFSYNPFYQQQPHLGQHPSNANILPFTNPQLIAFQQSQQHQSNSGSPNPSQIHAQSLPLFFGQYHPGNNYAPIPISIPNPQSQQPPPPQQMQQSHQQQQQLQAANFKQQTHSKQFKNVVNNERPNSPSTVNSQLGNPGTSEEETESYQNLQSAHSQSRSNSISGGRIHRKSISNSSANLNSKTNRQHQSSHSGSLNHSSKTKSNTISPPVQNIASPGQTKKDDAKLGYSGMLNDISPISPGLKRVPNPMSPKSGDATILVDSEINQRLF